MPTRQEITERIIRACREKMPQLRCSLCGTKNWDIGSDFIPIIGSETPNHPIFDQTHLVYPLVPLICHHCGNTHLINLLYLGFSQKDLAEITKNAG
jgi:hypothetical protein